jgi:hypothetical protein
MRELQFLAFVNEGSMCEAYHMIADDPSMLVRGVKMQNDWRPLLAWSRYPPDTSQKSVMWYLQVWNVLKASIAADGDCAKLLHPIHKLSGAMTTTVPSPGIYGMTCSSRDHVTFLLGAVLTNNSVAASLIMSHVCDRLPTLDPLSVWWLQVTIGTCTRWASWAVFQEIYSRAYYLLDIDSTNLFEYTIPKLYAYSDPINSAFNLVADRLQLLSTTYRNTLDTIVGLPPELVQLTNTYLVNQNLIHSCRSLPQPSL